MVIHGRSKYFMALWGKILCPPGMQERNANSLGLELCARNKCSQADTSKDWYFEDATVRSAIELTKELVAKYAIITGYYGRQE